MNPMGRHTERNVSTERQGAEDEAHMKGAAMKKAMNLVLEEAEVVEHFRILMDAAARVPLVSSRCISRARRAISWKAVERS